MTIFRTFTDTERAALKIHGLDTHQPSQLSDAFVLGLRYRPPLTVYRPCEQHKHLPVQFDAVAVAAVPVCPHCAPSVTACWCSRCNPGEVRMFVCPDCGCKRCPRADSHEAACTGKVVPADTPSGLTHTCSGCEENRARLDAAVQAAAGVAIPQTPKEN